MRIETWLHGCWVTVSDWWKADKDGTLPIWIYVEYFTPGSAISNPAWSKNLLCPRAEENTVITHLDSIINAVIERKFDK